MEYTNEIKITMNTNNAAQIALKAAVNALTNNAGTLNNGYRRNPSESLADALTVVGNTVVNDAEGYFTPEDIKCVMEVILEAIASELREESFKCTVYTDSTYACYEIEASYSNSKLNIKETYLPAGYVEYLCCPECGEEIVRIDEYDAEQAYYCPECGDEIDLSEQYEEYAPVVTETTMNI